MASCLIVTHIRVVTLLSSHVKVRHFCFCYCSIWSWHLQRRPWVQSLSLGPFCVEYSSSVCESPLSLVVQLPQTLQRHAHKVTWVCCGCSEWWLQMAVCLWKQPWDTLSTCLGWNPAYAPKNTENHIPICTCAQQLCHSLFADKQTFRQRSWCKTARGE